MNRQNNAGFTILELLIVSVVSLVVVTAAYQLISSQTRLLASQTAMIESRDTNRRVATLLQSEIRNISSVDGDLYSIAQDSIVLRSYLSTSTMCAGSIPFSGSRYLGLRNVDGRVTADSAKVYSVENNRWSIYNITDIWPAPDAWTLGNASVCFWGDSTTAEPRPQMSIKLAGPVDSLSTIGTGAPVRIFQRIKFGLFPDNGRWYVGRRVEGGAWERLMGPMLSPNNGGLSFSYYDVNNLVTTDPALVSYVEFMLQSESLGRVSRSGTRTDSLSMTITLRNN